MKRKLTLELTEEQIRLLAEALDSYVYWQLSSVEYRRDCTVVEPGADDVGAREEIVAVMAVHRQLQSALGRPLDEPIGPRIEWSGSRDGH